MMDKTIVLVYRVTFVAAALVFLLAIWEKILHLFGYSIAVIPYSPGRILELATILFLIVITLLLRQIRETLKK